MDRGFNVVEIYNRRMEKRGGCDKKHIFRVVIIIDPFVAKNYIY